jgi:hypothetical protein
MRELGVEGIANCATPGAAWEAHMAEQEICGTDLS